MTSLPWRGVFFGFLAGVLILLLVFAVALVCLPYRIALPPAGGVWYCTNPIYPAIGYLSLPINVLTNDLSRAYLFAPLSLLLYALIGFLIVKLKAKV